MTKAEGIVKFLKMNGVSVMDLLKKERNSLLEKTDAPWGLADYQHPNKQSWLDYRQALRDLPETADPQLDENGQLTNIVWPEEPQ